MPKPSVGHRVLAAISKSHYPRRCCAGLALELNVLHWRPRWRRIAANSSPAGGGCQTDPLCGHWTEKELYPRCTSRLASEAVEDGCFGVFDIGQTQNGLGLSCCWPWSDDSASWR